MQPNQSHNAQNADIPPFVLSFGADASVVTGSAQNIPPSGAVTSTTVLRGQLCGRKTSVISQLDVNFTGAANVSGQTVQFDVIVNGVTIAGDVLVTPLATTAGVKSASVSFPPRTLANGDIARVVIKPSATLDVVLTLLSAVLS